MFVARVFLASVLLLQCLISARYIGEGFSFQNDWREVSSALQVRQASNPNQPKCRSVCGSNGLCGGSSSGQCSLSKRTLFDVAAVNETYVDDYYGEERSVLKLQKRAFENPRGGPRISRFLNAKTSALVQVRDNPNTNLISIIDGSPTTHYSYATGRKFSDFSNNILNMGTPGLEGCTVLTVVSKRAVYMGHFFETQAFSPAAKSVNPDTAFDQNCLNRITGNSPQYLSRGDALDRSMFNNDDDHPVAFIMTPRPEQAAGSSTVPGPTEQMYESKITRLKDTLRAIIPRITIVEYCYIAINVEKQKYGYQGKAFFEYDPNSDGNNTPNFRVWYEATMYDGQARGVFA